MTTRERFNKVMHWQKPDRVPNMDFGYWDETITTWHEQGLPRHVKTNVDMEHYLGLEGAERIPMLPLQNGLFPQFEYKILEEKKDYQIIQSEEGLICEIPRTGATIPKYLKYGIENREDWELYKEERVDYKRADR